MFNVVYLKTIWRAILEKQRRLRYIGIFESSVNMLLYPVAIYQKADGFHAFAADMPLTLVADSMASAINQMREAILAHLLEIKNNGNDIPLGQDLSAHLESARFEGCTWAIISLDPMRLLGAMIPINVLLPEALCERVAIKYGDVERYVNSNIATWLQNSL